jgi:hypothetical protein
MNKNTKKLMTADQFGVWVNDMLNSFDKRYHENPETRIVRNIDRRRKEVSIFNSKTGRFGVSKCREGDAFFDGVGTAIAWARYNGWIVPMVYEQKPVNELVVGDVILAPDDLTYTYIGKNKSGYKYLKRHGYIYEMDLVFNCEFWKTPTVPVTVIV